MRSSFITLELQMFRSTVWLQHSNAFHLSISKQMQVHSQPKKWYLIQPQKNNTIFCGKPSAISQQARGHFNHPKRGHTRNCHVMLSSETGISQSEKCEAIIEHLDSYHDLVIKLLIRQKCLEMLFQFNPQSGILSPRMFTKKCRFLSDSIIKHGSKIATLSSKTWGLYHGESWPSQSLSLESIPQGATRRTTAS